MKRFLKLVLSLAAACASAPAWSQYPDRPVRIVVPYAAGGGIDLAARSLATGLGKHLGQQVIVENRPGGNSVIGANAVVRSAADGYTLLFTSGATVSVLPHITKSLPFDPRKDLQPVGKVAKLPFFLVVNSTVPAKDLREFITLAKTSPGKLTYASAGSGTGSHLGFELLKRATGVDITHVAYKATNEALPDLLTGRVSSMMADPSTVRRPLGEGTLRALAVTTKDRSAMHPAVPTVAEQGVAGFDLELWFGLFAPANTPPEIVSKINAEMRAFLKSPAGANAFDNVGFSVDASTPEDLSALANAESARWGELARAGVLKAE